MTGQKTKNKPKKYDVFGYELNDRYDGNLIPSRIRHDGTELKYPSVDTRIPLCKCGHTRENHQPCEGNWSCNDEACSKQGSYCWFYEPPEGKMSYKEQIGKQAKGITNEGHWDAEINDFEQFLDDNPRYRHDGYEADPDQEEVEREYDSTTNTDWDSPTPESDSEMLRKIQQAAGHTRQSEEQEKPRVATSTRDRALGSAHTGSKKPKKAMISSRAKNIKKCPRCKAEIKKLSAVSRRDNKTEICVGCEKTEGMLDNQPLKKLPSTLLLQEEEFQRKLGLDFSKWLDKKAGET